MNDNDHKHPTLSSASTTIHEPQSWSIGSQPLYARGALLKGLLWRCSLILGVIQS